MSEVKKSVLTAAGVVLAAGAVIAGATLRGRYDLGGSGDGTLVAGTLKQHFVSRDDNIDVPAADYFYELSDKLKKEFVEPVVDDQKLASGAVRGMIASLADPKSLYYSKEEFAAYLAAREGKYSGIGADLELKLDKQLTSKEKDSTTEPESNETSAEEALVLGFQIPKVVVSNVVPGGPADKAGIRVGDVIYSVDGHWVANAQEFNAFRDLQMGFLDKKVAKEKYIEARNEMRKKTERALMPMKVRERLFLGVAGKTNLVLIRGGAKISASVDKGPSQLPEFSVQGDTIRLPLTDGAATQLNDAIRGKAAITLDLRNNVNGDFGEMRRVLAVLAPAGTYGILQTQTDNKPSALSIEKGNSAPPKITLLVDGTTSGAAEILASALTSKKLAILQGGPMGGDRAVRQIVQLPDGSGYTLVTGIYSPTGAESVVVQNDQAATGGSR